MKQIIKKYDDGNIYHKYYVNHLNQLNGIAIGYWDNGKIWYKFSYLNDKKIGVDNDYYNNKLIEIIYHL